MKNIHTAEKKGIDANVITHCLMTMIMITALANKKKTTAKS